MRNKPITPALWAGNGMFKGADGVPEDASPQQRRRLGQRNGRTDSHCGAHIVNPIARASRPHAVSGPYPVTGKAAGSCSAVFTENTGTASAKPRNGRVPSGTKA